MIRFIINPKAFRGKGISFLQEPLRQLQARGITNEVFATNSPLHAASLAKEACEKEAEIVVAVGGDGTMNEVLQGLMEGGGAPKLAILPGGTGNDYVRSQSGAPHTLSEVLDAPFQENFVGRLNGRYFLNSASIGFDAEIAARMRESQGKMFGGLSYTLAALKAMRSYRPMALTWEESEETKSAKVSLVVMALGRYYGGGIPIAPLADTKCGQLSTVMINECSGRQMVPLLFKAWRGDHLSHPLVKCFPVQKIRFVSEHPVWAQVDGEVMQDREFVGQIAAQKIRVAVLRL